MVNRLLSGLPGLALVLLACTDPVLSPAPSAEAIAHNITASTQFVEFDELSFAGVDEETGQAIALTVDPRLGAVFGPLPCFFKFLEAQGVQFIEGGGGILHDHTNGVHGAGIIRVPVMETSGPNPVQGILEIDLSKDLVPQDPFFNECGPNLNCVSFTIKARLYLAGTPQPCFIVGSFVARGPGKAA